MSETSQYVMERRFDAPPEMVWRAWTDQTYQSRWYGPGVETVIHANEPRPGGRWLVEMKSEGWSGYQRADYLDVDPPSRLVFLQSMTDADWNVIANPRMPDWPRVMQTEIDFAPAGGDATDMRLVWTPHDATEAETAFFATALEGAGQGWTMGMDILDRVLAEMKDEAGPEGA